MKFSKLIAILTIATFGPLANAQAQATFSCTTKSAEVQFEGEIDEQALSVTIHDETDELMIKEFKSPQSEVEVPRSNRKKEANYKFAKYYIDFNAWQDLEFSIPKDVVSGKRKGKFGAFFTVFMDGGDMMAPSESIVLDCKAD